MGCICLSYLKGAEGRSFSAFHHCRRPDTTPWLQETLRAAVCIRAFRWTKWLPLLSWGTEKTRRKHTFWVDFEVTQLTLPRSFQSVSPNIERGYTPDSICCHTNTAISTPKYSPIVSDDVYVLKVKCKFNMATQPPVLTYTITYM